MRDGRRRRLRLRLPTGPDTGAGRPCVLLLAPHNSYRIAAFSAAAESLGIELLVASEGRYSLVPEIAAGLRVDFQAPEAAVETVLRAARGRPIGGVVSTDDVTTPLASLIAQSLGLPHNPITAAQVCRRKDHARRMLAEAGVPVPFFMRLDLKRDVAGQTRGLPYPCVVKPLAMSGSRGVIRADTPEELVEACRRIRKIVAGQRDEEERRYVLVEEFLPGLEVAVDGILSAGTLRVLAVFDKPDPLDGPYFEETYYVTPSRLDGVTQSRILARVREACAAYGLREGPIHAELRIGRGDVWVIEVAARSIGGDCGRLLRFEAGRGLEEMVLENAVGCGFDLSPRQEAAGVLMIPTPGAGVLRRVEGVLEARRVAYIEDVEITIREGYELTPLPEGSSYLGFVFARGPTADLVEASLRRAHACLNVVVAPSWQLAPAALA